MRRPTSSPTSTRGGSSSNGEWKADVKDATGSADKLGTEFSVSYLPGLKQYALVTTENGLSDRIIGRFAASPEGPWSDPVLLYTCPEMKKDKKVFTYAAKAHPHLAKRERTGHQLRGQLVRSGPGHQQRRAVLAAVRAGGTELRGEQHIALVAKKTRYDKSKIRLMHVEGL